VVVIGLFLFFSWLMFASAIAVAASNRGRDPFGWFFLALLLSPLVAGIFLFASDDLKKEKDAKLKSEAEIADSKVCPRCAERVKAAALVCRYCSHEFAPAGAPAAGTLPTS